jgi:hypothetical protein
MRNKIKKNVKKELEELIGPEIDQYSVDVDNLIDFAFSKVNSYSQVNKHLSFGVCGFSSPVLMGLSHTIELASYLLKKFFSKKTFLINWRDLALSTTESTLTLVGLDPSMYWVLPLVFMLIYLKFSRKMIIKLTNDHAKIFGIIGKMEKDSFIISDIVNYIKEHSEEVAGDWLLSDAEIERLLVDLEKMGCVKRVSRGFWMLNDEYIQIP